jgi:hypothetical protein
LKREEKTEQLILKLLNNLLNKDCLLALAQDLANLEELMDIF